MPPYPIATGNWNMRLYVAGQTTRSAMALMNLKKICEENLSPESYKLEIVDLLKDPSLALRDQIFAIPTLVRLQPGPTKKIIGDLSDTIRVKAGLGLPLF